MASASRKLLKELPSEGKMSELMFNLKEQGDQTTAIMGAAYLEHALELLLKTFFRPMPKKEDQDRLYSGASGGALGTFSAKIRIAYAAGIIHEKVHDALLLINDVRNVFAHSLHKVDFKNELVARDCQTLRNISPRLSEAARFKESTPAEPIDIYSGIVAVLYHSIRAKIQSLTEEARIAAERKS